MTPKQKKALIGVIVAVVVIAIILVAIALMYENEPFSTFSGPANPIVNVYAAKPDWDPRYNVFTSFGAQPSDFTEAKLLADAKSRSGCVNYAAAGVGRNVSKPCTLVTGPAPCRAEERFCGVPSPGDRGSPWLCGAGPPPRNTIGAMNYLSSPMQPGLVYEGFKPQRAPSVGRADGGSAHTELCGHSPATGDSSGVNPTDAAAYTAAGAGAPGLSSRHQGFTQLMSGRLAAIQSKLQPNTLTGVGQGLGGDPRIDPTIGLMSSGVSDNPLAPGTHSGGPFYETGFKSNRFMW